MICDILKNEKRKSKWSYKNYGKKSAIYRAFLVLFLSVFCQEMAQPRALEDFCFSCEYKWYIQ